MLPDAFRPDGLAAFQNPDLSAVRRSPLPIRRCESDIGVLVQEKSCSGVRNEGSASHRTAWGCATARGSPVPIPSGISARGRDTVVVGGSGAFALPRKSPGPFKAIDQGHMVRAPTRMGGSERSGARSRIRASALPFGRAGNAAAEENLDATPRGSPGRCVCLDAGITG